MIYRFSVRSEESKGFRCEIVIDSESTFLDLMNAVNEAAGFENGEMSTMYLVDDEGNRLQEISLIDMDGEAMVMEETSIGQVVTSNGDMLFYVFDMLEERGFILTLIKIEPDKNQKSYKIVNKKGTAPKQIADLDLSIESLSKIDDIYGQDIDDSSFMNGEGDEDAPFFNDIDEYNDF